jgi:hypothetical protein
VVELLRPQQPRVGLPHHLPLVGVNVRREFCLVESLRLRAALREDRLESTLIDHERLAHRREPQPKRHMTLRGNLEHVMRGRLRPAAVGLQRIAAILHDEFVKRILHKRRRIL